MPAPPTGTTLEKHFSVSVAMEYRGHWVRLSRYHGDAKPEGLAVASTSERLDGTYPYESGAGKIESVHTEFNQNGKRLFYGDTMV